MFGCVWQAVIRELEREKSRMSTEIEVRSSMVEKDADLELDQVCLRTNHSGKIALRAHVACVPRLRERQSLLCTLLSQNPE